MLLDVVESVLGHIGHTQVGVLPHCALWGLQLSGEQLDHGGLAGSVGSNDSHAGVEGDSDADALEHLAGCVGVSARQREVHRKKVLRCQQDSKEIITRKSELRGDRKTRLGGLHLQKSLSCPDPLMLYSRKHAI